MAVESAADLAGLFADFGEAGTLTIAALGQAVPVRVLLDRPEEAVFGAGKVVAPAAVARLQASTLPARPRRGDALSLTTAGAFQVASVEADFSGAELRLTLTR